MSRGRRHLSTFLQPQVFRERSACNSRKQGALPAHPQIPVQALHLPPAFLTSESPRASLQHALLAAVACAACTGLMGTSLPMPEPTIVLSAEEAWGLPHVQHRSTAWEVCPSGSPPWEAEVGSPPTEPRSKTTHLQPRASDGDCSFLAPKSLRLVETPLRFLDPTRGSLPPRDPNVPFFPTLHVISSEPSNQFSSVCLLPSPGSVRDAGPKAARGLGAREWPQLQGCHSTTRALPLRTDSPGPNCDQRQLIVHGSLY